MDDEDERSQQIFRQFGELNSQLQQRLVQQNGLQHHVGQVVRGVIPGAGPQHQYHPNPYLQHLYHHRQQARGQEGPLGGAQGSLSDLQNLQIDTMDGDIEAQLSEVISHNADPGNGDENQNVSPVPHTHGHTHAPRQSINAAIDWKIVMSSASFALILFLRLMVDHILGLLIFIGLSVVFYYGNLKMVEVVHITSLRERQAGFRPVLSCLWLILFLAANIACTYYMFSDQQLWRVLCFHLPSTWQGDLFDLFWVTMVTDNVVKFGCIAVKCVIALTPHVCLRQKQKGKYYMFIEVLVQLYRHALPIIPWIHFLYDNSKSGRLIFAAILVMVYLILKGYGLGVQGLKLKTAFQRLKIDTIYGTKPSNDEIKSQGENGCPICQDDYQDPIMLSCKHIFCENCVSVWFDREKTCPMCRHEVQTDSPLWRDGSTSGHLQWY